MTSKTRNKVESTIETCRAEGKWRNVIELTEELKSGSPNNESLALFLVGEAKLENYLEENSIVGENLEKIRDGLAEPRRLLLQITGENGQKAGIALDAYLLLAKLCYACGEHEKSLENFIKAELNTLSEKSLTLRSLKILAESYAIKGLCLENQIAKPSSKYKKTEKESEMISSFEKATDLGLLYLQEQDNTPANTTGDIVLSTNIQSSVTSPPVKRMGTILETALQRAPIVLIKAGKLQEAIDRYRNMLSAIETRTTQSLRLTLARQLAEVLLRGVSGTVYAPPQGTLPKSAKKLWKPRKYMGRNHFIPKNQHEETILLLLISESLSVKDAVLSQSPEFKMVRQHAMDNATAVYDLLSLATIRWGLGPLLNDSFEKALKFSYGEQHIWKQYGISLASLGRYKHSLRVFEEVTRLIPNDPLPSLLSARLCYESLGLFHEGLHHSKQALAKELKGLRPSRSQLYVGIGYQQIANQSNLNSDREKYHKLALEAFQRAVEDDENDHLSAYYLALEYALLNNIPEAMHNIRCALALRAEHSPSLHLFTLILTATEKHFEALNVVEDALEEFPENLNLLHVKAHLELYMEEPHSALKTVQSMLNIWRDHYESQILNGNGTNGGGILALTENADISERHSDTKSIHLQTMSQFSDKDSSSIYAASIAAASKIDQALSEAASSMSSFSPKSGPQRAWMLQLKIWLLLADVYLAVDQPEEASNCINEASQIYPLAYQIMLTRGQYFVHIGKLEDAKENFFNAVAANPCNTESLRALGEVYYTLGDYRMAEKFTRDAAKYNPDCYKSWYTLGLIMEALGEQTSASDCFATALDLQQSYPVLPFTSIAPTFE